MVEEKNARRILRDEYMYENESLTMTSLETGTHSNSIEEKIYGKTSLKIILRNLSHHLSNILSKDELCPPWSLPVLGKPLVVLNIEKIVAMGKPIASITVPGGFSSTASLLQSYFPSIQINEANEQDEDASGKGNKNIQTSDQVEIPLLSYLANLKNDRTEINQIVYPWDWYVMVQKVLNSEIQSTRISKNASIAKTSVIDGLCIIEDDVTIDDFCKIKGPAFIGRKTTIGTSCLIRGSMIGENCAIGYNCEAARTYLTRDCVITHQDTLLDSILGQNSWLATYVVTANMKWNSSKIKYKIGDKYIDTNLTKLGCVMGYNCKIGTSVTTFPGRYIPPDSIIPSTTVVE